MRPNKGPAVQKLLDLTSVLLGKMCVLCVLELVSIEKCEFSFGKTNYSMVLA